MMVYLAAAALFLIGLRLAAFFSGAETGFYRVSFVRVSIDAQTGDKRAQQILQFVRNPSRFVVTALIGNNASHYILTAAIGVIAARIGLGEGMAAEVVSTLFIAPIVFTFGELIPKNLYYRSPLHLLRRDIPWFTFFYRVLWPISFPITQITRLLQKVSPGDSEGVEQVLGRNRLVQVLNQGHQQGLLTDVQSRLVEGLMQVASQPVTQSMMPAARVLGVAENASREDTLEFARRFGLSNVAVRRLSAADAWFGYVRVIDVALSQQPLAALIHPLPVLDARMSKLEALLALRTRRAAYGVVQDGPRVAGLASDQGLTEQLFRAPQTVGTPLTSR